MIRVLIADDQLAVREGVRAILALEPKITVVGEAADGEIALAQARSLRPDVLVLDNRMPGRSGLEVARALSAELPDTGIVFLALDPSLRDLALAAGAMAFVPKDAPAEDLLRAVRAAAAALRARGSLSGLSAEWRRVVELLLAGGNVSEDDVELAIRHCGRGESLASAFVRLELVDQGELAETLARASTTPLVSIAPYPEIGAPIAPTEARLSSPRLVDPIDHAAARLLPLDLSRGLGLIVTAASGGEGVVAMADPLDANAHREAERRTRLRLSRVAAPIEEIQDGLLRAWANSGPGAVIDTGDLRGKVRTLFGLATFVAVAIAIFALVFRDALAPRFAFSLFALFCGVFFFLYALKYYVTAAAVLFLALFGDSLTRFRNRRAKVPAPAANADAYPTDGRKASGEPNGHAPRGQHHEGYRTLRGEQLDSVGTVMVDAPWPRIGELRLPVDRQPFVSVQLALYNERHVVDRLMAACTTLDYENYEVIVVDDSTDDTVQRLERWQENPRVKVIHRSSRKGFKGGALQEALRRMNPKTEYVMIFDADFIPPADAIWHFLDYFGRLGANGNGNGQHANGHGKAVAATNGVPQNGDRLAVVQGYQWHMLNASENWITKGVRAEFAGSYVLERAGQELFGAMKMISGSVYMIRADVLRKLGWSTSITEDWELTIRLYLAGYKVLYTPYIQAPAECVSTIRRLIKQRMRWAEGHTYNVKKYFLQVLRSPNLTVKEKLEFVYYAPYYLQSVLFSIGTLSWILGVFVLGVKLPMWGELFGWSLVVSNALALPLMNLAGVLLEGSLRRDAAGLLSFIGLSWILVPFQAYASLKGLFEREEGGWVRTPKSGRVTEALAEFKIAKLFPWELPGRSKIRQRSRFAEVALTCVGVAIAVMVLGVGALSAKAAGATGTAEVSDLIVPVVGTGVPLGLLIVGWLRLKRKIAVACIALSAALAVNVVFLAGTIPAAGVTDNSGVFTFKSTSPATAYAPGYQNMVQNYTPTSGTATTCPSAAGANWGCTFNSDAFSAGQSIPGGSTAQADLYLENTNQVAFVGWSRVAIQNTASAALSKPSGIHTSDVMLASLAVRGGTGTTVTAPDATWNVLTRVDNGTTISIVTYWHAVTNAATEPASYTFTFNGNVKGGAGLVAYSGVDNGAPIDQETGQTTPSGTSHTALSVTTGAANTMLVTLHAVAAYTCCLFSGWTPPTGMTERVDTGSNTGSAASNLEFEMNDQFIAVSGTATGAKAATSFASAVGATKTITLKPPSSARTCTVTAAVKKQSPIWLRSVATGETTTTALTLNQPAGTQQNDVLVMVVASTAGGTFTPPTEFTQFDWTSFIWAGWHVVGASDPGPYTFSWVSPQSMIGWIGSYVGVDTASPADPTHPKTSTSGTSHSTNTISPMSTATQYEMLIAAFQIQADAAWTAPADMLEVADFKDSAAPFVTLGINHALQPQATTSIVKTATSSVSGSGTNVIFALNPLSSNTTSLGSTTVSVSSPSGPTLVSTGPFALAATSFTAGDHLILDVSVPDDPNNCPAVRVSYDSTAQPSKLTIATIVPEGVAGLILLAPALPIALRWWKRRRTGEL